ncbi:TonB-dependent receptor [Croceimicrobium sp.]|uniref:TonB-dependent receptor n=1 Tax=Croceimicrobium sp. TaxID=2828340 RepID=UPI003BA84E75
MRTAILSFLLFCSVQVSAQFISGHIHNKSGEALEKVNVQIKSLGIGTSSDADGHYQLELKIPAEGLIIEFSHVGYLSQVHKLKAGTRHFDIQLQEDHLGLEEVVVSGSRQAIKRHQSPVIVETINSKLFDRVAALSLAEGLSFSPGLRVENNCQNCGFTQLRINGLDGAYSQVLLNSRPIFSSLMAVYGLEMIPASMIEKVEVVRGGGSALYGGNAIGGTVNIITKEAVENGFHLQSQVQALNGEAWEQSHSIGSSYSAEDLSFGFNIFAFNRKRQDWDANQDGFSEITRLRNQTLGLNSYWKPNMRSKWSLDLFHITEFRRGGSDFDLEPHQSQIAEQLEHQIMGGGLAYEQLSADGKRQLSIYTSAQNTERASYYGAGGRIIPPGDSISENDLLALNAYGNALDYTLIGGFLINQNFNDKWQLSLGSEYQYNLVDEEMPGYERHIKQALNTWGTYLQSQYDLNEHWKLQAGIRLDISNLNGNYLLASSQIQQNSNFLNWSPRLNLQYILNESWQFRTSYARGYRIPQAFNEDLHIETVGGAALFIQLDENLKSEESHSFNTSAEYLIISKNAEHKFLLSGFYTLLARPFVLVDRQALPNGTAVQTKSNGEGATVRGLNLEYQAALHSGWQWQASFTAQQSLYSQAQTLWQDNASDTKSLSTNVFLRSPNLYGYLSLAYKHNTSWTYSTALNFTGPMYLARLINPISEELQLTKSPSFLDWQIAAEYKLVKTKKWESALKLGVKNLTNAFQSDLPQGPERDATYIYGPILPRTYYLSISLDFLP